MKKVRLADYVINLVLIFFVANFTSFAIAQKSLSEADKIEQLLLAIGESDLKFIRNKEEHSAGEAAAHLRKKLKAAQTSFFAPSKDKWTAAMFIEKVASKSSLSGKSYMIKKSDGQLVEAKAWLTERLKKINDDSKSR